MAAPAAAAISATIVGSVFPEKATAAVRAATSARPCTAPKASLQRPAPGARGVDEGAVDVEEDERGPHRRRSARSVALGRMPPVPRLVQVVPRRRPRTPRRPRSPARAACSSSRRRAWAISSWPCPRWRRCGAPTPTHGSPSPCRRSSRPWPRCRRWWTRCWSAARGWTTSACCAPSAPPCSWRRRPR